MIFSHFRHFQSIQVTTNKPTLPYKECVPGYDPNEQAAGERRATGFAEFGDKLGYGESVVLAQLVEQSGGVVLDHLVVVRTRLLDLSAPAPDELSAAREEIVGGDQGC